MICVYELDVRGPSSPAFGQFPTASVPDGVRSTPRVAAQATRVTFDPAGPIRGLLPTHRRPP